MTLVSIGYLSQIKFWLISATGAVPDSSKGKLDTIEEARNVFVFDYTAAFQKFVVS